MANRAFRRMIEYRRTYSSYPMALPGEYTPAEVEEEPVAEELEYKPVEEPLNIPGEIPPETAKEIYYRKTLDNLRGVWNNYKEHLKEKYPPENGEEFQFTCEYHQAIEKILS